ncbi:MAG: hypothetical protein ACHQ49_06550 [Elusimicrobiota bacterium]
MSAGLLKRCWFALTTAPARLRFRAGRASFVECSIARTECELTPVLDRGGRPLRPKLLARHTLACRPPRAGAAGWNLYEERLFDPKSNRFASLECAYCGHLYVIEIQAARPDLAAPDGSPLAAAAAFRCDWFRFAPSAFAGPAELACPRCEETAPPVVAHLHEP